MWQLLFARCTVCNGLRPILKGGAVFAILWPLQSRAGVLGPHLWPGSQWCLFGPCAWLSKAPCFLVCTWHHWVGPCGVWQPWQPLHLFRHRTVQAALAHWATQNVGSPNLAAPNKAGAWPNICSTPNCQPGAKCKPTGGPAPIFAKDAPEDSEL